MISMQSAGRYGFFFLEPELSPHSVQRENPSKMLLEWGCIITVAKIHEKWTGQKPVAGGAAYKVVPGIGVPGFTHYDDSPSGSGCG